MQAKLLTWLLFIGLFVVSTNSSWACGMHLSKHATQQVAKNSNCDTKEKTTEQASCDKTDETNCPCDHENGGCSCPGCQMVTHVSPATVYELETSLLPLPFAMELNRQSFYFARHQPKVVYFSIWHPPKLV